MKRFIAGFLAVVLCLGMVGCSGGVSQEDYDALKSELEETKKAVVATASPEVTPEATVTPTVKPTSKPTSTPKTVSDVSTLVPSQQIYQFEAGSGDSLYGSYSFEVTNTFDTPVIVEEYSADFYGADGAILGHDSNVNLVSRVITPGQKAYSGNFMAIDTTVHPEDIEKMEISLRVKAVNTYSEMLDFENVNLLEGNYGLKVTGKAINNTSSDASLVSIVVVSLGENDKLLDVTYVGSIHELAKGESGTFEIDLETDTLTRDQVQKVFALGYDFEPTLNPEKLPRYDAQASAVSTSNTSSLDELNSQAEAAADDLHKTTIEALCEQLRPQTTYEILNDGTVEFVLPIEDEVTTDTVQEVYDSVNNFAATFALTYKLTGSDKFIFSIRDNEDTYILNISMDLSGDEVVVDGTANRDYYDIVKTIAS